MSERRNSGDNFVDPSDQDGRKYKPPDPSSSTDMELEYVHDDSGSFSCWKTGLSFRDKLCESLPPWKKWNDDDLISYLE